MNPRLLYLGRVERLDNSAGNRIARLRVLYVERPDNTRAHWADVRNESLDLAAWLNAPASLANGSIWQFRVVAHDGSPRERWRVLEPQPPIEILKLSAWSVEAARQALCKGIRLDSIPSDSTVVWVDEKKWIGPLRLTPLQQPKAFVIHQSSLLNPLNVFAAAPNLVDNVFIDESRQVLGPGVRLAERTGSVDWASDSIVLRRFLRWAKTEHAFEVEAATSAQEYFDRLVLRLESTSDVDAPVVQDRLQRVAHILTTLRPEMPELDGVIEELLDHPALKSHLESLRQQVRDETIEQVRAELEGQRQAAVLALAAEQQSTIEEVEQLKEESLELRDKLDTLNYETEIAQLLAAERKVEIENELAGLEARLDGARVQANKETEGLEEAIASRVNEAVSRPLEALAQVSVLRALMGHDGLPSQDPRNPKMYPRSSTGNRTPTPAVAILPDYGALKEAVRQQLGAHAISPALGPGLTTAFLSDVVPLVSGFDAVDALTAFAAAAFGSRCVWLPVSPALIDASDLFGTWNPDGTFREHPAGLLDLVYRASETDDPWLVVLDGVNAAAADNVLGPLVRCCRSVRREGDVPDLPLLHTAPDGSMRRALRWPANLFVAGTLVDSPCSIHISPSFWCGAAYLNIDDFAPIARGNDSQPASPSSVTTSQWEEWRKTASVKISEEFVEWVEGLEDTLRLPASLLASAARSFGAYGLWSQDRRSALRVVVETRLVPYAVATGQTEILVNALEDGAADAKRLAGVLHRAALVLR